MTNQEIFDRVWNHFIVENNSVSALNNDCPQYKDEAGNKCTIGILIPDELYRPAMEGLSYDSVLCRWPKVLHTIVGEDNVVDLLSTLQGIHDYAAWQHETSLNTISSKQELVEVAKNFNLSIPKKV